VLGSLVCLLLPIVLTRLEVIEPSTVLLSAQTYRTLGILIIVGLSLCLLAPTDWKTRGYAIATLAMVLINISIVLGKFSIRRRPKAYVILIGLCVPAVFLIFIARLGNYFGSNVLCGAAWIMGICVYLTTGLFIWLANTHWKPEDQWLLQSVSWVIVGLISIFIIAAVRIIVAVIVAAIPSKHR